MNPPVVRFVDSGEDDTIRSLESIQEALLRHPLAVQAAFAWLAAEGRRFAGTSEGLVWQERLGRSELVAQLRLVWDSLGMTAFSEESSDLLPTFFVEGLVSAASAENIEAMLTRVISRRM